MAREKTGLSTGDVCLILESSAKAGVSELKFGGLHVTFGRPPEQLGLDPRFVPQSPAPATVAALTEAQHQTLSKASIEQAELDVREAQLAQALVEDPELYERLQSQGELTDAVADAEDPDID